MVKVNNFQSRILLPGKYQPVNLPDQLRMRENYWHFWTNSIQNLQTFRRWGILVFLLTSFQFIALEYSFESSTYLIIFVTTGAWNLIWIWLKLYSVWLHCVAHGFDSCCLLLIEFLPIICGYSVSSFSHPRQLQFDHPVTVPISVKAVSFF